MACKDAKRNQATDVAEKAIVEAASVETVEQGKSARLMFGADSKIQSNDLLQNNLTVFEWAVRNKIYPNFWGRNISGENSLTKEEIDFLHKKGCKIAAIYIDEGENKTEEQGEILAKRIAVTALELGIPANSAVFLEIRDNAVATTDYMRGFAKGMLNEGYIPGFKANTDANYDFDREFSRGMQTDKDIFDRCLIWAVTPSLAEYDRVTTTHLIHPDNWMPYAPSGITRNDIAVWQYGKDCHPINDDAGKETAFNVDLVRNENIVIEAMF